MDPYKIELELSLTFRKTRNFVVNFCSEGQNLSMLKTVSNGAE